MAGDQNILQGLRIQAGGWLRSVNLQEPRRETVSFHQNLPHFSQETQQPDHGLKNHLLLWSGRQGDDVLV